MAGFQCRYANQFPWHHEQVQVAYSPCAACIARGYNNAHDIESGQFSETSMTASQVYMAEGPSLSVGAAIDTHPIGLDIPTIPSSAEAAPMLASAQELPSMASID